MAKKESYTLKVNGKDQPQPTTEILAAIVASPFATETAAIVEAVMQNEKFLEALKKADIIAYDDNAKTITTDGPTLVSVLPHLADYHKAAAELARERERLNNFRATTWKNQRGRKQTKQKIIEADLNL